MNEHTTVPPAERASPEQVARLNELFARANLSDYQINLALTKRGVDRVEMLSAADATTIETKLARKLDADGGPDELAARIREAAPPPIEIGQYDIIDPAAPPSLDNLPDNDLPTSSDFDWAAGMTAAERGEGRGGEDATPATDEKTATDEKPAPARKREKKDREKAAAATAIHEEQDRYRDG